LQTLSFQRLYYQTLSIPGVHPVADVADINSRHKNFRGKWKSMGLGLIYENGADDPRGHRKVEEITFGYLLGLVEIVIRRLGQVNPPTNFPFLP
jgi:hypothetical protein